MRSSEASWVSGNFFPLFLPEINKNAMLTESLLPRSHNPSLLNKARFLLSKGHAAPVLYAAWAEAGLVRVQELQKLREWGCDLEGHPTPRLPFVDVATGSLGQGLSVGVGEALCARLDR